MKSKARHREELCGVSYACQVWLAMTIHEANFSHHQKGQGNDKHDYGAAKQISWRFVSLFSSKHGTLDELSKTKAVKAGLITTCWAPFGQLISSERIRKTFPVQDPIHIPVQQAPLRVVFVQTNIGH